MQLARSRLVVVVALTTLVGCGRSSDSGKVASVDLAPTIAQLGAEEEADVDGAIEKLVALGDVAVPALEDAVRKQPKPIQVGAIGALAQIGTPRADAVLVGVATKHDDDEVRATALLRLGTVGRPAGRPVLEASLNDPSTTVSQTAAMACGICTSPSAIDRIVDVGLHGVRDGDVSRIRSTLVTLLNGKDQAAAAHARETIRSCTAPILAGDAPLELRTRAALFAADAGLSDVEPVLTAAAAGSTSPPLRAAAINWLGRFGSGAAVPVLASALADSKTAFAAGMALQVMSGRGIPEAKAVMAQLAAQRGPAAPKP